MSSFILDAHKLQCYDVDSGGPSLHLHCRRLCLWTLSYLSVPVAVPRPRPTSSLGLDGYLIQQLSSASLPEYAANGSGRGPVSHHSAAQHIAPVDAP